MRRDDPALPFYVGVRERALHRMRLKKESQLGQFFQVLDRYRRDFEAATAFRDDEAFCGQAAQDLAQRADADIVGFLQAVELQLLPRPKTAKDNVGADAAIAIVSDGFDFLVSVDQRHWNPQRFIRP